MLLIVLRLGLSVVFGVAGVAKLLDQKGTREAVVSFGLSASWAKPFAWLLPVAELAIAIGLLSLNTAPAAALAALLLLALFITAIAINLSRGRTPDCHCFGQLYSRPLGWPTLARNVGFAVGAMILIWQRGDAIRASGLWLSQYAGGQYAPLSVFIVAVVVSATIVLLRQAKAKQTGAAHDHSSPETKGLPVGSPAPEFQLPAYRREQTSLNELLAVGKPVLLIFSNPHCGPCAALFQELAQWQHTYPDQVTIAVVTQGTLKENFVNIARNDLRNILFQEQREIAEAYQCLATPTGVLVSAAGLIASTPAPGADNIRALINSTLADQQVTAPQSQFAGNGFLPQASTQNAD